MGFHYFLKYYFCARVERLLKERNMYIVTKKNRVRKLWTEMTASFVVLIFLFCEYMQLFACIRSVRLDVLSILAR